MDRATPLIEADLERVRWLLGEVSAWDESLAPRSARQAIGEYYRRQEDALVAALTPTPVPLRPTPPALTHLLADDEEQHGPTQAAHHLVPVPPSLDVAGDPSPEEVLTPARASEVIPVAPRPSVWQLTWKPFLSESLGWFLGAFLILSGALYLVADAWEGMTSTLRALTVFGMVEAWAVAFAGWAAALSRKDSTRAAAIGLRRIAALVAPLAVLALGPALSSAFSWLALLGGSALAGALALRAAKDLEEPDALLLTASVSLATLGLGLAPLLPSAGGWLVLAPAVLAAFAFRRGARSTTSHTVMSLLAFLLPVAALITRLLVSQPHTQSTLSATWVVCAVLASAALWLRDERSRGPITIVALSVFFVAFLASFTAIAPACVLIAGLGVWTTWRLSREATSADDRRHWWLAGSYVFAYLAWQRLDQLAPAVVWTWWASLKVALHYAATPMPASYGSVYQSLFVAVGTLVAGWRWLRSNKTDVASHVWLRCSAIAATAAGALAMVSVSFDARPAVVALPLLLLPLLLVGVVGRRTDEVAAGSILSGFFALALGLTVLAGWPAAVIALALALGAHGLPRERATRVLRRWWAGAALACAGVAFLLAAAVPGAVALSSLVLATAACLLAARALHRHLLSLACFTALVPLAHLQSPLLMALVALGGAALLFARHRRWSAALPTLAVLAIVAPASSLDSLATQRVDLAVLAVLAVAGGLAALRVRRWWWVAALIGGAVAAVLVPSFSVPVPAGMPWLASALALGLLSRRLAAKQKVWLEAPALLALVVSVAPHFGLWAGWSASATLECGAVLALGSSIHAVRRGRTWQGSFVASLAVLAGLATLASGGAGLVPAAAVALLATPALVAWLTVPLAAALLGVAWFDVPNALLAISVVTALVAPLEESDWAWRNLLNRASLAWVASLTSVLALLAALIWGGRSLPVSIAAVLLPMVWARATRRAEPIALGLALSAAAGPWWVAPLLALAAGRLLALRPVRYLLAIPNPEGPARLVRRRTEEFTFFAFATVVAGLGVALAPVHAVAWFGALLLMGGTLPALRIGVAVAIAVPFEPLRAPAVGALVALGAAAHHAPVHLKRWLGARSLQYVEPVALLLGVGGAAVLAVLAPSSGSPVALGFDGAVLLAPSSGSPVALGLGLLTLGLLATVRLATGARRHALTAVACVALGGAVAMLAPQWMLPVTVAAGAVLLGVPALIPVAILAAGLDLAGTFSRGEPVLSPHVFLVAFLAALGSMTLRWDRVSTPAGSLWRWLGREAEGALASPLFWGALGLSSLLLLHGDLRALWLAPLLLVTPQRWEAGAAFVFGALATAVLLPASVAVPILGSGALVCGYASTTFTRMRVSKVWLHASWVLALLGIGLAGVRIESSLVPLAWSVGAATVWLHFRNRQDAGWAWAATGVSLHVVMAFVGAVLSTGAPKVLIFPWWAAASGALALLRHLRGGRASVLAFGSLALVELVAGTSLLASAQPREALLSVLVAGVLVFIAWRRVVDEDETVSAWLGQGAVVSGALAARVLGVGALPGLTEAWVLLGVSAVVSGLAQFMAREGRRNSAGAFRVGALTWPVLGALLVPWGTWSLGAGWLLGLSVLCAWVARSGSRRTGALASAVALNAAVVLAAVGSGFGELQLLLIPLGLTVLVLTRVFHTELSPGATVQLRAWGMGLLYAAVAWTPLTVTSVPALVVCVMVCLGGVALGALWRIRSYVVLGSGVLVTTVLATLVRSGLSEPRLGAVFLSLLGLGVVVVMVMLTTRREELQARLAAMQQVMATWEG